MAQKKSNTSKRIFNLIMMVPLVINLFNNFIALLQSEAKLAWRPLIKIIFLGLLLLIFLLSAWLCVLGLLFVYLSSLGLSIPIVLAILLAVHVVLMLLAALIISKLKRNIAFPLTTKLFFSGQNKS